MDSLFHLLAIFRKLLNDKVLKEVEFASPDATLFTSGFFDSTFGAHLFYHVNEHVRVFRGTLSWADNAPHLGKHHYLVLKRIGRAKVYDAIIGVAHDCNEHVEERDMRDDCCNEEESVDNLIINMHVIGLCIFGTQHDIKLV